jgi:hypothetical protein
LRSSSAAAGTATIFGDGTSLQATPRIESARTCAHHNPTVLERKRDIHHLSEKLDRNPITEGAIRRDEKERRASDIEAEDRATHPRQSSAHGPKNATADASSDHSVMCGETLAPSRFTMLALCGLLLDKQIIIFRPGPLRTRGGREGGRAT